MINEKEKYNAYMRKWKQKNRDKRLLWEQEWRNKNKKKLRISYLKHYYKYKEIPGFMENRRVRARFYAKAARLKLRDQVLQAYGSKCVCCKESIDEFLTIDHINGRGSEHRKKLNRTGTSFYRWLKINGFPKGFQILCRNCNWAKFYWSSCPHQR